MLNFIPWVALTVACALVARRVLRERLVVFWLLWSGVVHVAMEASYGLFPEVVRARATTTFGEFMLSGSDWSWFDPRWWSATYGQYARYDGRYAEHDPIIVFICYTEILLGPACFLLAWMIQRRHRLRHPVQLVLCTCQIYGTVLYFAQPLFAGNWAETITDDPFELLVFVVVLNGLWIGAPLAMIAQSFYASGNGPKPLES